VILLDSLAHSIVDGRLTMNMKHQWNVNWREKVLRAKPVRLPLRPPKILHGLPWD